MQQPSPDSKPAAILSGSWPSLRQDLTLHEGPRDASGAPTWTLHDPARNQYFSIDWIAFEVLVRLGLGGVAAIVAAIRAETTLQFIEPADVESVILFLQENELLQLQGAKTTARFKAKHDARKSSLLKSLIHNYLFFRIPLFRTDRFLGWLVPRVAFLWSGFSLRLTGVVFLLGVWGAVRQWDTFSATLVDTFSLEGLLGFAGALIVVKVFHELGHGLTAKRFGCRVPTMGVAFLVMWPMAYTDVTESWKLDSHQRRLIIAAAGIVTELIVAAWALLAWSIFPDGGLRSAAFFLATTSIVTTLAINASPFMRFDGYFLLCDFLGMPNLHQRSFAMARWWLRERLFRLGDAAPEELSATRQNWLVVFAIVVWSYRFVVFVGIAILVYQYFFKLLGIALFAVEIWYFIARPVWHEIREWRRRWPEIGPVVRERPAFYAAIVVAGLLLIPYDMTVHGQGLMKAENILRVITFQPSRVLTMPPPVGAHVEPGAEVMVLESPELEHKIRRAEIKLATLQRQHGGSGFDTEMLRQQAILLEQVAAAQEEYNGLLAERARLKPVAPFGGRIVDVDPDLTAGAWQPKGAHLMTLIDDQDWVVDCYIVESELSRIGLGHPARFVPEAVGVAAVWGQVVAIDRDATRALLDGTLASTAGGEVLVRRQKDKNVPERAIYRVRIKVSGNPVASRLGNLRGAVTILGFPKSVVGDIVRGTTAALVRESGF